MTTTKKASKKSKKDHSGYYRYSYHQPPHMPMKGTVQAFSREEATARLECMFSLAKGTFTLHQVANSAQDL